MHERMSEQWRVRDLAALVDLSPSRFAHLFQRTVGISPLRYLRQLRMARARQLLEESALEVREVRRLVGCTDASHFSRDFRREYGVGPRDHRRRTTPSERIA